MPDRKTRSQSVPVKNKFTTFFLLYALFLFFSLLFTYSGVFNNFFFTDDAKWLYRVSALKKNPSAFFQPIDGKFRPFVFLVFLLEFKAFGYNPAGYYFINLFFHFINSLLIFFLVKKLCKNILHDDARNLAAFLTSFLFSIQMIVCVPVLWISLIHDILNATFYLSCILFYISFHESRKLHLYFLSFLFFFLSSATKEVGFSLPLALLLVQAFIFKTINAKFFLELVPFFLLDLLAIPLYSSSISASADPALLWKFIIILSRHITEAARAMFGFSQNRTLWLEPYFLPGLFQKILISRALLAASIIFFLTNTAKGFWRNKPARKAVLGTFTFGFFWSIITFLPHFPLQHLILWDWVAFSPGYHYFYLSTIGLCFPLCALMSMLTCPIYFKTNKLNAFLLSSVMFSLFLANFFPIRHMEEVYGYHSRTLKYLLSRAETALPVKSSTKLLLENFPSQYESLHYSSLPFLMNFFHIPLKQENIFWTHGDELKQLLKVFAYKKPVVILQYHSPLNISVFNVK